MIEPKIDYSEEGILFCDGLVCEAHQSPSTPPTTTPKIHSRAVVEQAPRLWFRSVGSS